MQIGTVIGNVWATRKEDDLTGLKFLFVQPEGTTGLSIDSPLVALDRIGAVEAALEAGREAAKRVGGLVASHIIPRPDEGVNQIIKKKVT